MAHLSSRIICSSLGFLIIFMVIGTDAIKCYQNQSRITEPFQSALNECSSIGNVRATGCIKQINFISQTVTRMCDYTNCTEQGIDRSKACFNTTETSTCCCLSDGCNSAPAFSSSYFTTIFFAIPSIIFGLYFTQ